MPPAPRGCALRGEKGAPSCQPPGRRAWSGTGTWTGCTPHCRRRRGWRQVNSVAAHCSGYSDAFVPRWPPIRAALVLSCSPVCDVRRVNLERIAVQGQVGHIFVLGRAVDARPDRKEICAALRKRKNSWERRDSFLEDSRTRKIPTSREAPFHILVLDLTEDTHTFHSLPLLRSVLHSFCTRSANFSRQRQTTSSSWRLERPPTV